MTTDSKVIITRHCWVYDINRSNIYDHNTTKVGEENRATQKYYFYVLSESSYCKYEADSDKLGYTRAITEKKAK